MSGSKSRNKGKVGEREFAAFCRAHGFAEAHCGRQNRGGPDSPDVVGVPGLHLEVKYQGTFGELYSGLEQAAREAPDGALPVVPYRVVRKGTGPGGARPWFIAIDAALFLKVWAVLSSELREDPNTGLGPLDAIRDVL